MHLSTECPTSPVQGNTRRLKLHGHLIKMTEKNISVTACHLNSDGHHHKPINNSIGGDTNWEITFSEVGTLLYKVLSAEIFKIV